MSLDSPQLRRLQAASRAARRRLALRSVLSASARLLPVPLVYALGALVYVKLARPDAVLEQQLVLWGALPLAVFVVGSLAPLFFRRGQLSGAQALDRHHGLADRVSNALAFAAEPVRTPLMSAAIEDALAFSGELQPRAAVPLRLPRGLWVSAALGLLVYGVSKFEMPPPPSEPVSVAPSTFTPLELNSDDVELLRDIARELQQNATQPEVQTAVREFNQLVEDIAERRLDRREIFERLQALERSLSETTDSDLSALNEGLEGVARELNKSALTKPVAQALEQKSLPDAEQALKDLAERLKQKPAKVDRAELERLRKALEAASKQTAERLQSIETQRQALSEQRERLLKKKNEGQPLSKREERDLQNQERQLQRLDRQKQRAEAAQLEMSELDKQLAQAARELMEEMGQAAESLDQGAQELNRMAQKELSEQEKEALKKQLEELRDLLRQQRQAGGGQKEMLERFRRMAQGQGQQGSGQPGQDGEGTTPGQQGKPGQGQGKPGQGKPGQGPGQLSLGLAPGQGQGQGAIPMPGQGQGSSGQEPGGDSTSPGGDSWGTGSTDDIAGDPSSIDGRAQDVSAAGIDSGEGPATVEVVYGAAERGFASKGYRKVYTDYKTVAEEVMAKDEIPPGYKFYVRRYFQLIRPRN